MSEHDNLDPRLRIRPSGLAQTRVLVMGDVMLDRYWFGEVNRISPEAPVPIALVKKEEHRLGGAANVARNITALGGRAGLIGIVGGDEAGQKLEDLLNQDQVDSLIYHDPNLRTILKLRVIGQHQQLLRIDFEDTPKIDHLDAMEARFVAALPDYEVVVFSDYGKGSLAHVQNLIAQARSAGKIVLVDPKGDDYQRYRGASLLTPNKTELRAVIGYWSSEAQLVERAQNLRSNLQLDYLLLTRSEEGMSLFSDTQVSHIPTVAREVFDVSGAGDTAIATLALMLAAGFSYADGVLLANRAAGISVSKFGTSVVSAQELWP